MILLFFTIIALFLLTGCADNQFRQANGAAWGTTYHITYKGATDLTDSVVAEMRRVELSLSMFDPESTVSRINRSETDTVDAGFAEVFEISRRVNKLSRGAFDPTVAPLVNLWGFGYKSGMGIPQPDPAQVDSALATVGLSRCRLSMPGMELTKGHPDTEFDFSAVAKGYGVDCVARMLRRNGCSDFMVEIGGEVVTSGMSPRRSPWRIAVDAPLSGNPGDSAIQVLELVDAAVATSGNYRNYINVSADSVIGHTINPLTGYPVARSVLSATVIAPTCALADALATACMAAPVDVVNEMLDSLRDVRIILVSRNDDGEWVITDRAR